MKVKWCLPHDINNNNPTFGEYRIGTKKTKVVLYVLRALAYGIFKIFYFTILKITLSIIPHHFTTFPTSQTLFLFSLYLNIFLIIFYHFSLSSSSTLSPSSSSHRPPKRKKKKNTKTQKQPCQKPATTTIKLRKKHTQHPQQPPPPRHPPKPILKKPPNNYNNTLPHTHNTQTQKNHQTHVYNRATKSQQSTPHIDLLHNHTPISTP